MDQPADAGAQRAQRPIIGYGLAEQQVVADEMAEQALLAHGLRAARVVCLPGAVGGDQDQGDASGMRLGGRRQEVGQRAARGHAYGHRLAQLLGHPQGEEAGGTFIDMGQAGGRELRMQGMQQRAVAAAWAQHRTRYSAAVQLFGDRSAPQGGEIGVVRGVHTAQCWASCAPG